MRRLFMIIISFFLLADNLFAQSCDCIVLDSSQKKLYLDGNNFTLIDNALRCFKLNSVGDNQDSLVKIWMLEDDFPDTPTTWRVKLFEFGKKGEIPIARLHILEWGYDNDRSLPVKCIKQIKMSPEKGWLAFERDIRSLNLQKLYKEPFKEFWRGDFGMLIIQFLFGHTTHTIEVDFIDLRQRNSLQYEHSKRVAYLFWAIEKHFSIKLSIDSKERDTYNLEGAMKHFKLRE